MRQVLSLALAAAALSLTTAALADEAPIAPATSDAPAATAPAATEAPAPSAAPAANDAPAPGSAATPNDAPSPGEAAASPKTDAAPLGPAVTTEGAPPAPAPTTSSAATPAPFASAPRFAIPMLAPQKDMPMAPPTKSETIRVGGMVGVGFPRPFAIEGFVKIKRVVGIGAEYSFMPDAKLMGTDLKFSGIAADLRVFPFKGGFFVGVRGGRQWLSTSTTVTINHGALGAFSESMNADTWFVNPRIGYLKTWDNGLTVGIDAGVQVPISPSYQRTSTGGRPFGVDPGVDETLVAVANVLGNKTTPTVDLLRVGFMF